MMPSSLESLAALATSRASARDIDTIFAALPDKQVQGMLVSTGQLFVNRRVQLATVATRHAVPTMFNQRDFAEADGLMS